MISQLKEHRSDVLKAEILSLFILFEKTSIDKWKSFNYFSPNSYFNFDFEKFAEEIGINNITLRFNGSSINGWSDLLNEWRSGKTDIQKILSRGCENINSGIDKGSPNDCNQLDSLWLSNAFGSFIKKVNVTDLDCKREFYKDELQDLMNKLRDNNFDFTQDRNKFIEICVGIYSNILSDSRFPVNDVTLFDQAYMSATMFKASLAGMFLKTQESQEYLSNPQSIKWQILGVQYDKLALAEKGLKPATIFWYRNRAKEVDNKVKRVIEVDYALGNEIYRDESGIYFLVPEGIGEEVEGSIFEDLNSSLDVIKCKIKCIFKDFFNEEVYPFIGLTKASRGTMNLTALLEHAKSNFLRADYSFKEAPSIPEKIISICQVCQNQFVETKEIYDDVPMCNICRSRKQGRVDAWLGKQSEETIWIGELADKNNRVALVTLKFELMEWLNGGLLNSLVNIQENYQHWLHQINTFIKLFYSKDNILQIDISSLGNKISEEDRKILGRKNGLISGVKKEFNNLISFHKEIKNHSFESFSEKIKLIGFTDLLVNLFREFVNQVRLLIQKIDNLLQDEEVINKISKDEIENLQSLKAELSQYQINIFIEELSNDVYIGCKKWDENFNDYIRQIFFGSITGNSFESEVKKSALNTKIDWKKEIIYWDKLEDQDIEILSKLLLQFLLRKNPSPARLRRVWESTEAFFKEVEQKVLGGLKAVRKKDEFLKQIEDFPEDRQDKIANETTYKQYFSIIDPTPISWQFIIPTQKLEGTICDIQKLYYQHFKYVNGKLPLHIGIVVQNYKKPLYVGIKALRNIRRDIKTWEDIKKEGTNLLKDLKCYEAEELNDDSKSFYSLYETPNQPDYDFQLLPSGYGVKKYNDNDTFIIYPNTIDFEFLDTNSRRNDIFYRKGKRSGLKSNRPYRWEEFECFKEFKTKFESKSSQLQKLVGLIYSKMEDWSDENSFKNFMETTFKIYGFKGSEFGLKNYGREEMKKFLDMFAYYHTTLKEL
jgi:CRISPR-associated Csx11 family protein